MRNKSRKKPVWLRGSHEPCPAPTAHDLDEFKRLILSLPNPPPKEVRLAHFKRDLSVEIRKLQRHNRGQYSERELDRIVTKLLGRHHLSRDGHDDDSFDNVQVEKHAHGYVIYADTWADSHPGTLLDITNNAV